MSDNAARCPVTGEEDCSMCSGEYCEQHNCRPCDCDVVARHRAEATDVEGYRGDDGWMPQIEMSYTDWPPPPVSAGQVMSDLYLDLYIYGLRVVPKEIVDEPPRWQGMVF